MEKKWPIITDIMMGIYAIASLITIINIGFIIPVVLLFIINMVNFLLFQFFKTSELLTAVVIIFTGFVSYFLLDGFISIFGIIFGIFGILYLVVALVTRNN